MDDILSNNLVVWEELYTVVIIELLGTYTITGYSFGNKNFDQISRQGKTKDLYMLIRYKN